MGLLSFKENGLHVQSVRHGREHEGTKYSLTCIFRLTSLFGFACAMVSAQALELETRLAGPGCGKAQSPNQEWQ